MGADGIAAKEHKGTQRFLPLHLDRGESDATLAHRMGEGLGVNWGEIYYNTMREVSQEAAEQQSRPIAALPIDIVGVGDDLTLARQAAIFKATHKMSYADCFAAALAKTKNAERRTGDPEFKALEKKMKIMHGRKIYFA